MTHRFGNRVSRLGLILFAAGGLTALGCSLIVEFDESKIPGEDVGVSETSTDALPDTQLPDTQVPDTGMPDTAMPTDSGTDTATTDSGTDTATTDSGTDTATTDSGTADTGTADTGTADTGTADTGTLTDTATDDTATDDTATDTGPADTGPADTGPADTGPADTGVEDVADTAAVTLLFSTVMTGAQENPPVTTSATGTAQCTLTITTTNSLTCTITHNVTDTTAAHIHGRASFGKNNAVLWGFSGTGATGATLTQTLTTTDVDDLMAGRFYINVHSGGDAGFPSGEIRGQLIPKGATFYAGRFTNAAGSDAGGATSTGGFGAFVTTAPSSVHYFGIVEGLSGTPTIAHVHDPAGALFELTVLGTAGVATTYLGMPTLTTTQLTDFVTKAEANQLYANVHTAAVPDGEARADLTRIFIAP